MPLFCELFNRRPSFDFLQKQSILRIYVARRIFLALHYSCRRKESKNLKNCYTTVKNWQNIAVFHRFAAFCGIWKLQNAKIVNYSVFELSVFIITKNFKKYTSLPNTIEIEENCVFRKHFVAFFDQAPSFFTS